MVMRFHPNAGSWPVVRGVVLAPVILFVLALATAFAQSNPIVLENQQPGATGWDLDKDHVGTDAVGQIKGYASATSINKGENITFRVSTNPAQTYTIDVFRVGWYQGLGGRLMQHAGPLSGTTQPVCPMNATTGMIECNWAASYTLATQTSWTSGVYVVLLTNAQGYKNYMIFVVRDDVAHVVTAAGKRLGEALRTIEESLSFDDPINIQYTSGTTGSPKGATLTHHNILNNGFFIGETMRLTEKDRICIPVPLYHCFGMVLGNLACVTHGSAMIYPGEAFDPLAVLETVEAERCTGLYGVPTMFIAELGHAEFKRFDLSTLRTGIMAGSPCPTEVMKRVNAEMHMSEVTICYGMTETSPVSFQTAADDPLEKRVGSVGRIHPHVEVKIVDGEGHIVPPGTPGELCTRGYSVMQGYWGDAEKTAEAIDAGRWMHTGDLATLDAEGYCNIVGRIKDMVIRGGENIYPREIEEFLYRHPKVQDVQVIGVPDVKYGEELCAWVRLKSGQAATPEEIREFCKGQIAHYKIPRYVKFVDGFPMTVTGKIQKYLMREEMKKELGLAEEKTA
jgi:acyl-CoA synthetase (AMP-forming)/AMP-acid ligase II